MQQLSALSTEYVRYAVAATVNGSVYNPTADTVQFAFPAPGVAPSAFVAGSWETVTAAPGGYVARCLIGPTGGAAAPGRGLWDVWVKITDSPEVPVRYVGQLKVT